MKKTLHTAIAGLLVLAPLAAVAQQSGYMPWDGSGQGFDNRWYVAPFGSYTWADNERVADDGWGGGFNLGKNLNKWWNLEFSAQYEQLDGQSVLGPIAHGNYKNWTLGLDALLFFNRSAGYEANPGFQPFVVFGVGGIQDRVASTWLLSGSSTWSWTANAGAGFLYHFNDRVAARVDGRYRWDDNKGGYGWGGNFGDWVATVGVQIALGDKPRPPAPPPAPVPVAAPAPPPPPPPAPVTRTFDLSADGMFAFGSSTLTPVGKSRVDNFIKAFRESALTVTSVKIIGHTDPIGSEAFNQTLSDKRAKTVADYMVTQGVSQSIITTAGAGESQLKITEAECKAQGKAKTRQALIDCFALNRRIEAHVTGTQKPSR